MALELRQQLKLSQQLVMTPQLQMAIRLLQLNRLELAEHITQELLENPVLEEVTDKPARDELEANPYEDAKTNPDAPVTGAEGEGLSEFDWQEYFESYNVERAQPRVSNAMDDETREYLQSSITRPETLAEHLLWQVRMGPFGEAERRIAAFAIGNLDADGYLDASVEEIRDACECSNTEIEDVLARIRRLDPVGVAARDLQECLLAQVAQDELEGELPWVILTEHVDLLETGKYKQIARKAGANLAEVMRAVRYLRTLEPKPARAFPENETQYVVPDLYVHKVGEEYVISLNEDGLPKLRVSNFYKQALYGGTQSSNGAKEYIQEKMKSALWLIKSIHQRQRTIYRVMEAILKFQREFFDYGIEYLKPLVLRDIAGEIEMHESTVSRVTSNKYVHTPRGIFALKYFFNSGISTTSGGSIASESVKDKIKRLVGGEAPQSPYTDIQLVELLRRQGIDISRRTVTKYRESLGIASSSKRKHFH